MTKLRTILLLFVTCCSLVMMAANQKKSVTQVTTEVTLTDDVDYQIAIAMRKGGIYPDEDYHLQRFEVVRYK